MPRSRVAAPPHQPHAHGLLAAMLAPSDIAAGHRWEQGYEFSPMFDVGDSAELGPTGSIAREDLPAEVNGEPFIVHRGIKTRQFAGVDVDLAVRAREVMAASAGVAFERHLWANPQNVATPNLSSGNVLAGQILSAIAIPARTALSALIDESASVGRLFIHCTTRVAHLWLADGLIREVTSGGARTMATVIGGHAVVVGVGYDGLNGPYVSGDVNAGAAPAGSHWAVATGVVVGELGEVTLGPAIERGSNITEVVATQTGRIYFDPATLSALPVAW